MEEEDLPDDWYPQDVPYNPRRYHDRLRGWLAAATLGLLSLIVVCTLAVAILAPSRITAVSTALDKVLAPVSGFAGLALAYFFGQDRRGM